MRCEFEKTKKRLRENCIKLAPPRLLVLRPKNSKKMPGRRRIHPPPPPAHRSIGESLLRAKAQPAPVVVVVLFLFLLLVCSPSGSPTGERREQFADPPPHHPPPAPTAPLVFLQQPGPRVHAARHVGATIRSLFPPQLRGAEGPPRQRLRSPSASLSHPRRRRRGGRRERGARAAAMARRRRRKRRRHQTFLKRFRSLG